MEEIKKRRGGRPPLEPKEKRSQFVMLSLTPPEYEKLLAEMKASGYKEISAYVRSKLTAREGMLIHNPGAALDALIFVGKEVQAIGKNINQLARYANFLKLNNAVKPQLLQDYTDALRKLTELELQMQKTIRGYFRQGAKHHVQ